MKKVLLVLVSVLLVAILGTNIYAESNRRGNNRNNCSNVQNCEQDKTNCPKTNDCVQDKTNCPRLNNCEQVKVNCHNKMMKRHCRNN